MPLSDLQSEIRNCNQMTESSYASPWREGRDAEGAVGARRMSRILTPLLSVGERFWGTTG